MNKKRNFWAAAAAELMLLLSCADFMLELVGGGCAALILGYGWAGLALTSRWRRADFGLALTRNELE